MQNIKRLTVRTMPIVLAVVMIVSMCLTVVPGPQTASAGECYPELIAPGHTTHLDEGQFYVVTAKLANETEETLTELYARLYAKQAESDDSDTPGAPSILVSDPAPVAPGTQDGGQDFDHDGDGLIENGDPSLAGLPLPFGWLNDRGLTSAGPDDGINNVIGDHESDDEGTGDNAWPWIPTGELGGDRWNEIKAWVDSGLFVPDCIDTINGAPSALNNYSNDFCSFNHIRMTGDEPTVKQLDPLPAGEEQTVGWQIQCIGTGDVDIRVYFWEEGHAGLMAPQTQELDSPCHDSLPDPADRDDWWNQFTAGGNGNQLDEDWIWFTESQLICQGPIQVPDIEIEFVDIPECIPVGQEFELEAVVTNNTPCEISDCGDPGWAIDVIAHIEASSLFPKVQEASCGGLYAEVGDLPPGASATVTFYLRCLEEGEQLNVLGIVECEQDTCTPQSCYQCYYDTDYTDIYQCGKPELEVEIISPADFMWDPYAPLYEGAAIHTGGEFGITARVWNIGLEEATNVWATLRDIPLDPKTEEPYFEVIDYEVMAPLNAFVSPDMYQDDGMQTWIPASEGSWLTNEDTYISNYDLMGYMKYLGDIGIGDYKIVEWTIMPTDVWTESLQTCDPAEVTGFTVTARRANGYPQASGAMIDDGPDVSSIAAWIADWSTDIDAMDDTCCNEAHCGNSFVSLQGTPHPWYPWLGPSQPYWSGTPEVQAAIDAWIAAGSQARVVVPEPISFDLVDHIGVFVNSGTEARYGGPGNDLGDMEVGLGPYCTPCGGSVQAVSLPIIQINIETLTQDVWVGNTYVNGDWLQTSDTDIRIFYQPGTPGWRHFDDWPTEWLTDADCTTWQYYGTMGTLPASYIKPGDGTRTYPADWLDVDGGYGWVIDWAEYDETGAGVLQGGNLNGFAHYTWAEIQDMFDRGTGTPAIATIKSFEIRNNHSGTPLFVDDIRIWDDFHGDLMKGDGPSEYTNDCINANYLDCNCPGIIETTQVLIYPAADLEVIIEGDSVVEVGIGDTVMVNGVIRNRGAASAWDVDLEMAIEKQPGLYPSAVAGADAYSQHFMSIPGGQEREFSWTLNAYEAGAYRIDLMPSGMDECGWHVKQNTDPYLDPNYNDKYEVGGKGNLLLVDDSSDYPIQWLRGDAVTAFVGVAAPAPSIAAEITYPESGDMFWKETTFAVTAELNNDGVQDLTGVEATLMLNDIGGTGSTIDGSAVYAVSGTLAAGCKDLAVWSVTTGDITGDCILKIVVTSNEGAMDMDAVTINVDPKVTLRLTSMPGGGIGDTADISGEGDYMFDSGEVVDIKAVANPGMCFAGWVGDTDTVADVEDATTTVTMNGDYEIVAAFADCDCADLDELLAALADYLDEQITVQELLEVLSRYLNCN